MQLHQLAYALAVAGEKSFTRAAASACTWPSPRCPAKSRLLEHELGVLLFNRGPGQGPVTLTPDGGALLPFMQRVLADVEATGNEARALSGMARGRLAVGATPASSHQRPGPRARGVPRQPPRHRPGGGGGRLTPVGTPGGLGRGRPRPGGAAGDRPVGADHAALRRPAGPGHRARPPLRPAAPGPRARPRRPPTWSCSGRATTSAPSRCGLPTRGCGRISSARAAEMAGVLSFVAAGLGRGRGARHRAAEGTDPWSPSPSSAPTLSRTVALAQRGDHALARPAPAPWPTSCWRSMRWRRGGRDRVCHPGRLRVRVRLRVPRAGRLRLKTLNQQV